MTQTIHGLPGYKTQRSATPKHVLQTEAGALRLPAGVTIDGAGSRDLTNTADNGVLQAGTLLGRVTATGRYAPSVIGLLVALHDTSAATTTLSLPPAVATELNRRVGSSGNLTLIGPVSAAGSANVEMVAFSAVDTTTGDVTITATTNDFAAGSVVAAADGSQTPRVILGDPTGVRVVDASGNNLNAQAVDVPVAGLVSTGQITHYTSMDSGVQNWVKSQLRAVGSFVFSDEL